LILNAERSSGRWLERDCHRWTHQFPERSVYPETAFIDSVGLFWGLSPLLQDRRRPCLVLPKSVRLALCSPIAECKRGAKVSSPPAKGGIDSIKFSVDLESSICLSDDVRGLIASNQAQELPDDWSVPAAAIPPSSPLGLAEVLVLTCWASSRKPGCSCHSTKSKELPLYLSAQPRGERYAGRPGEPGGKLPARCDPWRDHPVRRLGLARDTL